MCDTETSIELCTAESFHSDIQNGHRGDCLEKKKLEMKLFGRLSSNFLCTSTICEGEFNRNRLLVFVLNIPKTFNGKNLPMQQYDGLKWF